MLHHQPLTTQQPQPLSHSRVDRGAGLGGTSPRGPPFLRLGRAEPLRGARPSQANEEGSPSPRNIKRQRKQHKLLGLVDQITNDNIIAQATNHTSATRNQAPAAHLSVKPTPRPLPPSPAFPSDGPRLIPKQREGQAEGGESIECGLNSGHRRGTAPVSLPTA